MNKLLLSSIILISLSACFQKNEKNNEGNTASESKIASVDSNAIYHLLECKDNCIDAKEIIFTNGKKIENIDDENNSIQKLLVNGQEYENIPFEVGGYLKINSIYPNKNGSANIALLTWNYRGSCCEWTEYHIIYADEDNLIPISLKIDPQDTFEEINFKIKEGKISNLNLLYTHNGKKISTPLVR
jgi:hypothetical protein